MKRDKKLNLLRQLGLEHQPISVHELYIKLNAEYSEIMIRRGLKDLIAEGKVVKSGVTKSTKYLVAKSSKEYPIDSTNISSCFSSESLKAIEQIKRPAFERFPCAYNEGWFDSYIPNRSFYLPENLRNQLHVAGQRASNQDPAGTYAHQIFNRLLIDLSYNSSRLEGNTYSLLDTERLLLHGDAPEGKLDEEKIMILNHKYAIRYLVDNAAKIFVQNEVIYTIHYLLSDALLEPKYAGKVRDHYVRISGSVYIPFENPKRLEKQMSSICEKAANIIDPFEQSIFLLIHISYLQAFADVNKRTARLCANIPLIINNLVPQSFNDVSRDDYISALLAIYELKEVRPLVDLYVFSYLRTCAAYDSTVKSIGFDAIRVRYRAQRRGILRDILLGNMHGHTLQSFIQTQSEAIPEEARRDFIQDIQEDLDYMDESRLAGLGVTVDQLHRWLTERSRNRQGL